MEQAAVALDAPRAGEGGNRDANAADENVQGLLWRRLAPERELDGMGCALIISALFLMLTTRKMAANPPAWVLEAAGKMGEQHDRALFFHSCTTVASTLAAGVVVLLCLYKLKAVRISATFVIWRVSMVAISVSMVMAYCVAMSEDWFETTVMFLFMSAGAVAVFVFIIWY